MEKFNHKNDKKRVASNNTTGNRDNEKREGEIMRERQEKLKAA